MRALPSAARLRTCAREGRWWNGQPPRYGGFLADVFIGARYYVVPQLAVYGELGFGVAYFTLGVSFKI